MRSARISNSWPRSTRRCPELERYGLVATPIELMALYSIEFNDFVKPFVCTHCGEQSLTVWGWIEKSNLAHAVYYAGLMTGHEEVSVRLTVSIGGWGEPSSPTPKRWSF